jgi:predicted dehydrogenase
MNIDHAAMLSRQNVSRNCERVDHRAKRNVGLGKVRLGIIGCGSITENAHLPAVLSSSLVDVTALSDIQSERLRSIQRQFDFRSSIYKDYRDTFSKVDAVVLALPNHLHAPIACEFLSRGIHVLCEKPLASSRRDCDRLCEAARSNGAILAVGYVTRFFPSTSLTKELLGSDFLGVLVSFDYEFGTEGGWESISGYNLVRETSGGGVLVVSGSHFIDRMLYLFGDVKVVRYADDCRGGVEANCVASVECEFGGRKIPGCITLSKTHRLSNRLRVVGEKGALEIAEGESRMVTFLPSGGDYRHQLSYMAKPNAADQDDYFKIQLEDFVRAIHTGGDAKITGEQGSRSLTVIEKCYEIATRLEEPWVDSTLQRLARAMPSGFPESQSGSAVEDGSKETNTID